MIMRNFTEKKILITGGHGFLGSHLVAALKKQGVTKLRIPTSREFDFRDKAACIRAVTGMDIVIHLAARVGGIGYNMEHPAEMFYDNILMGTYLLHEAWKAGVQKFVSIGTICCYPKITKVPFSEEDLWNGYPEETNAPYGLAKKMLLVQSQAYRTQHGFNAIFLLPVNMYGPGDNFDPDSSHVIAALIRRFIEARNGNDPYVEVWGSGKATREFLYVEDAALAIVRATRLYDSPVPVNIGAGFEISIKELARKIKKLVSYKGEIRWDTTKPDGQPRRMLSVSRAKKEFGFTAATPFDAGLKKTITWYEAHR